MELSTGITLGQRGLNIQGLTGTRRLQIPAEDTELLVSPLAFISSSITAPIHLFLLLHLMISKDKLNVHFTLLYLRLVNSDFLTVTIWVIKIGVSPNESREVHVSSQEEL